MENGLNDVQKQQIQIFTRNDRHEQDVKILKSNIMERRDNLTKIFDSFVQKLNSTQEKQLELVSHVRDHGHGNKQQIDNLASEMTKFKNDIKLMDQQITTVQQQQVKLATLSQGNEQKINVVWTNLTDSINRLTVNSCAFIFLCNSCAFFCHWSDKKFDKSSPD